MFELASTTFRMANKVLHTRFDNPNGYEPQPGEVINRVRPKAVDGRYKSWTTRAVVAIFIAGALGGCQTSVDEPIVGELAAPRSVETVEPATDACPGAVSWEEAADHIGDTATVAGPVKKADYRPDVNGGPTFISIGRAFPDPDRFNVVVWEQDRGDFDQAPEELVAGETICVEGPIEEYDGIPQVIARSDDQITVVE